ncbi:sensor histidine kinase [Nonomuraea sp. CA-141351]|uniref:sensor histidine kinase n=1 Tax=Nonomuraea sp. CA-141351 TaxID=3239996 RepID=UPI003D8FA722
MATYTRWTVIDVLLGAAVAVWAVVIAWTSQGTRPVDVGAFGLIAMASFAVVVRRRHPLPALLATDAATLGWLLAGYPGRAMTVAALIACFTVAAERGWRWGFIAAALNSVTAIVALVLTVPTGSREEPVINAVAVTVAAVALGTAVYWYGQQQVATREKLAREARAREQEALRIAAEERVRIAREVHDVCAHAMAAISVQAGVALHVIERQPGQAVQALTAIKKLSDEGLTEVRAILGTLRREGGPVPVTSGLQSLDTLLDTAHAAGLRTELTISGDARPLPQAVDLTAYRIIQESLTNVRRHARATSVAISISYEPRRLSLEILDDGKGGAPHVNGAGHGIRGMRERVAALHGEFSAAPRPSGGFEVRCVLPLPEQV